MLLVTVTATAEDDICLRGCRRGVILPTATRGFRVQKVPRQPGGDFYYGNRRQLVVLATFRDQAFQGDQATTLAKWDKIFNAEHYHEGSYAGSVHDYFYEICAKIRSFRMPEPYKGKGILFKGEVIRRKSGKSASAK